MYVSKTQGLELVLNSNISEQDLKPFLVTYNKYSGVLKNVNLRLKYSNITKDFMRTMYPVLFFLSKKEDRKFTIHISNNNNYSKGIIISQLKPIEKRGWYAHELAHVMNFSQKSNIKLLGVSALYLTSYALSYVPIIKKLAIPYIRHVERSTDNVAINQGLGYELARGSYYFFYESNASEKMKKRYSKIYTPTHTILNKTIELYFKKLNNPRNHSK
jgi:hypothetical protein